MKKGFLGSSYCENKKLFRDLSHTLVPSKGSADGGTELLAFLDFSLDFSLFISVSVGNKNGTSVNLLFFIFSTCVSRDYFKASNTLRKLDADWILGRVPTDCLAPRGSMGPLLSIFEVLTSQNFGQYTNFGAINDS